MKIPDITCKIEEKLFVTVHPRNAYILELPYHLWLPFLYQPQSDVVAFFIISVYIYKYLVTVFKHVIFIHDKVTSNESLEKFAMSIV